MSPTHAQQLLAAHNGTCDPQRAGLTYAEWIHAAWYHPDQGFTWREHERLARLNYRDAGIEGYELGGEG
jgi:hypothetical protein